MASGFRKLKVWQRAKALAVSIYRMTSCRQFEKDWGLRDQMRRCAVSIPSNIAEGEGRISEIDSARFLSIARGSAAELMTQLEIAQEIGYLEKDVVLDAIDECEQISSILSALILKKRTKPKT